MTDAPPPPAPDYPHQPAQAAPNPYAAPTATPYGSANPYAPAPQQKTNTLAIVSLVASISAFIILPFIGSIVGIITGHMSLGQIKRTGEAGRGLGLAGTIVGWVGLALTIIGTIIAIAWFTWLFSNYGEYRSM